MPEKKSITGVTFVRITGPLAYLRQAGHFIDWMPYSYAREAARQGRGEIGKYDLFILQRAGDTDGKLLSLVDAFHRASKKLIWESDDDYTNEYRSVLKADAISVARACDAITVSTPGLREQMRKHIGPEGPPIYLLQNCIDFNFWDKAMDEHSRTVPQVSIGMIGTPTHYDDWMLAAKALYRIGEERPEVNFVVGGFLPQYLQDLPNLTYLEPVQYQQYPGMVRQIDIGLAPLEPDDPFNWSKSGIKAMEYWCSGAAVVASNAKPYQRVYGPERMLLAETDDDWYRHITALLDNPSQRQEMAAAGREWVRINRNMERNAPFWWDAYMELFRA
jgi:glycosyltransferase involved in cell wall biosynthesis